MYITDGKDWRNIENGMLIPSEQYTDQPYLLKTDDGAWLCCVTTGSSNEGNPRQHVITMRSYDQGKTWVEHNELESASSPESAYSVLLKIPSGRIFAFYNYNEDNIRHVIAPPDAHQRVDCLACLSRIRGTTIAGHSRH
ncbi:MAG: sialidase family protein [Lentisphaerota bacterium]